MRKRVRFSTNHDASQVMLANLLKKIDSQRNGTYDTYADQCNRPLSELLSEYLRHHSDRGNAPRHASQAHRRCETVFEGCGFVLLRDLNAEAAENWLAARRLLPRAEDGISSQTNNHDVASLKAFGNQMVKARRIPENPFRHMRKLNASLDVRHQRRAMVAEEFSRLIDAARGGADYRGLFGPDRAALYLTAGATGLRASELGSLTPSSFDLDAETPVVVVEATYSKHRRRDEVPLHPDLVVSLRPWIATKAAGELLWGGKWATQCSGSAMIQRDLATARTAWLAEAKTTDERATREASDFLLYRDHDGEVADFHSTRHIFITNLVAVGVMPEVAR